MDQFLLGKVDDNDSDNQDFVRNYSICLLQSFFILHDIKVQFMKVSFIKGMGASKTDKAIDTASRAVGGTKKIVETRSKEEQGHHHTIMHHL